MPSETITADWTVPRCTTPLRLGVSLSPMFRMMLVTSTRPLPLRGKVACGRCSDSDCGSDAGFTSASIWRSCLMTASCTIVASLSSPISLP